MAKYNKELNKVSLKSDKELDTVTLVKSAIEVLRKYSNQVEIGGCIDKIRKIHNGISSSV